MFLGCSWHQIVKAPALSATNEIVLVSPALMTS